MPRRRLYPLPIEALADSAEAITLPPAAYGAVIRIALHFWLSECRELPRGECELRQIARAHGATWRAQRDAIMRVFNAMRPELERAHKARLNGQHNLTFARLASAAKRRAHKLTSRTESSPPLYASGLIPVREANPPPPRPPQPDAREPRKRLTDRAA